MKVLLVNTNENTGGAAIACLRLMSALQKTDIDVKLLVKKKRSNHPRIIAVEKNRRTRCTGFIRFAWERFVILFHNRYSRKNLFSVSIANTGFDLTSCPEVQEADIIHLHWINQGFLSLNDIQKLCALGKPVVWTLHDLWPITGICHHPGACTRYLHRCGNCPQLQRPSSQDLSFRTWKNKKFLKQSDITFVSVSRWLQQKARQSALTGELSHAIIPNTLDTDIFYRQEPESIRQKLSISSDEFVVLFGAAKLNDPIKGFDILCRALRTAPVKKIEKLHLLLFGNIKNDPHFLESIPCKYTYLGPMSDMSEIAGLYSAADVTVVSSHYETFGQTLIESMACGTLTVAFNQGGQTDIINHLETGYLARYPSADDLGNGILWAYQHKGNRPLQEKCIENAQKKYSEATVASQYRALYEELLNIKSQS